MRRHVPVLLIVICVACSGTTVETSTSSTGAGVTTTATSNMVTTVLVTSTTAPPDPCPPAPYDVSSIPPTVVAAEEAAVEEPDEFTSVGGTNTRLWLDGDGAPAIALIRGTLPPDQFPGERGEVDVAGSRAVAGPYPDGRWVVAWFNPPGDRCDLYTMVFYPPVSPTEVEATVGGMERVPG